MAMRNMGNPWKSPIIGAFFIGNHLKIAMFATKGPPFARCQLLAPSVPLPLPQPIVVRMMMMEGFSV
jgi:hypothetical protein